jgi:hypothetical protein
MNNRSHWFILEGMAGGDIGIIHVYAPNDTTGRIQLWEQLATVLSDSCKWILGRDMNMVELRQDKTSKCGRMITQGERLAFNVLK